ncbi:acetolactate synthase [Bradyrhizobium sp. NAS80.1]|nr:acetolactate synthase [Bradyrhizobium sp. NAS80.1]
MRGADLIARTLELSGSTKIYALTGNHIMSIYDAAIGTKLDLIHTRHEASTVYMADAWARLSGACGIALVSSGAGHANALGSLPTALAADAPLVLLSGHAGLSELGRGAFQEMKQAEMAASVCKASITASDARRMGHQLAACIRLAMSGRPGPVHMSLPVDLLEETFEDTPDLWPTAADFIPEPAVAEPTDIAPIIAALQKAERPMLLAGPWLCRAPASSEFQAAAAKLGVPIIGMESPRGINDPSLGRFAQVLAKADLVMLLGKPHDQTIKFGQAPFIHQDASFVAVDPDVGMIERAKREQGKRLVFALQADPLAVVRGLTTEAPATVARASWSEEVAAAVAYRPAAWPGEDSAEQGRLHPAELCRGLEAVLKRHPDAVLICDGGEIPQWPQTIQTGNRRLINGVGASIGGAAPFAIGARHATDATVIAVSGDGAFGFHFAEMDTALRHNAPIVMVIGNDATWNAEHQLQLRAYGKGRAHGCDLLLTRYDRVVEALGGHGEHVTTFDDLVPALERAIASGRPACVNVEIRSFPAPVMK